MTTPDAPEKGHTPGPWKFSHDRYAGHYDVSTYDPARGSEAIAQVLYVANKPGGRGEADARLIAAAPELLDLLCQVTDDLEAEIEGRRAGELPRRIERDLEVVRKARAAIAKATTKNGGEA